MNTLKAGSGATSLYGGAGRDSLVGADSATKKASTEFFYTTGNDLTTITNFEYGTEDKSDKLNTWGVAAAGVTVNGSNVEVQVGDNSDDRVILTDAKNQKIQANISGTDKVVEVGDSLTYGAEVTNYYGDGSNAMITVAADAANVNEGVAIWANRQDSEQYFENIKGIDASAYAGNATLVGSSEDNTITAGSGDASLWGGFGGNDTLYGGSGENEYFFLKEGGHDVIAKANDGDVVNMFGISLDDIDFDQTTATSEAVVAKLKDGSTLTLNTTANVTYKFTDGSQWSRSDIVSAFANKNNSSKS